MLQRLLDSIEGYEFRPLDEQFLRDLWPMLAEIVRNPSSNPPAAIVLLLIVIVAILIIGMTVMTFLISLGDEEDDYEYVAVPVPGTPDAATPAPRKPKDPLRLHRGLLWFAGISLVLVVSSGITSNSRSVCLSCHEGTSHTAVSEEAAHGEIACTGCHERGGAVSSYVSGVPARLGHIASGMFEVPRQGYGIVTDAACAQCHKRVDDEISEIPERGLRVSHAEPLDAGATCMDCHELGEDGQVGRSSGGMGPCLRCHDGKGASAECSTCHTEDVSLATLGQAKHEPRQIIGRPDCYTCHEPAKCDSCHGVRLPHPEQYQWRHMRDAARDLWFNEGKACSKCHTGERNSCYKKGCHANALDFHRADDPSFPRNHGSRSDMTCDVCHQYPRSLEDPCKMCH